MRILLIGPTAVGKTKLSIELAKKIDGEIISGDSRQCYRYLNIGTATPSEKELSEVRHYNISILDPSEKESAARFYRRAMQWEEEITARGKHALYVGGSTLHLQSIIKPLDDLPESDRENREKLKRKIEEEGIEKLYEKLTKVDPEYAQKMDGMNPQRIIRALDVWMQTGKPFSSFHSDDESWELPSDTLVFGLNRDRDILYERINQRVDRMFRSGFLNEVNKLLEMGYTRSDHGLNTVGYREAIDHLRGSMDREEIIKTIKAKTRQYAKRQLTWFRRWDFVQWIDLDHTTENEAIKIIREKLAAEKNKI